MSDEKSIATTEALQAEAAEELNRAFENILPWTLAESGQGQMLDQHTEKRPEDIQRFLDSLYLFIITEVSVAEDRVEEAVSRSLGKRHQALVTAAYQSELTLATVIVGNGGGVVSIYLGVSSADDGAKEIFLRQVHGIYPGKGIDLQQETRESRILRDVLSDKTSGGIITGIPPVRLENERQSFDLTSVVRSMHGQPFVLMSVARPVSKEMAARQIMEIMKVKDECHSLVSRTVTLNQNQEAHQDTGLAVAESTGGGDNSSVTKGGNVGGNASVFGSGAGTAGVNLSGSVSVTTGMTFPTALYYTYTGTVGGTLSGTLTMGGSLGGNLGISGSKTKGDSTSKSTTTTESESAGWSKSIGESLQLEQQNSLAMELEHIADKLIKRLRIGLNSGVWEVFLTYATASEVSSRILSGAVCGDC